MTVKEFVEVYLDGTETVRVVRNNHTVLYEGLAMDYPIDVLPELELAGVRIGYIDTNPVLIVVAVGLLVTSADAVVSAGWKIIEDHRINAGNG